jgi:hypothetical protein
MSSQTAAWFVCRAPLSRSARVTSRAFRASRRREHRLLRLREFRRGVAPAPGLDARHRDGQRAARRREDGEVDDPVLLRAHQLLAVHEQHRQLAGVRHGELRHRPALGDFGDAHRSSGEGVAQRQVAGRAVGRVREQRDHGEPAVGDGVAGAQRGEGVVQLSHVGNPLGVVDTNMRWPSDSEFRGASCVGARLRRTRPG